MNIKTYFGQDQITKATNEKTMGLTTTFALWLGANVVVTTILTGMFLVPSLQFTTAMSIVFLGSGIAIIPLILIGVMGQKTGLTTMMLAKFTFGKTGANIPAFVNVVTLIAWSWIQALLAGMSLNYAVETLTGFSNIPVFTVLCEVLVVGIAIRGHVGIEKAEKIVAVLMMALAGVVLYALLENYEFEKLIRQSATGDLPIGVAFDIVIATAFSWIPLAADYNRHCKTVRASIVGTWGGYVLATCVAMGLGALVSGLSLAEGFEQTYDPTKLLANFGFGLPAAMVIFFSVLTTNVMCVYSATLSYMSIRQKSSFIKPAIIIGTISVLGSLIPGILEQFQNFLLIIGSVFIPAFSLMIVDYFLIKEKATLYKKENHQYINRLSRWNRIAIFSYLVGACLAYYWNWVSPLEIGASLPVFLITGVIYYFGIFVGKKAS